MTAAFILVLDTKAPANPSLTIEGGASRTGSRGVRIDLSTQDYLGGAGDVTHMRIWGDVDPTADPQAQPVEDNSAWQVFQETTTVMLSEGEARKTIRARLRDDVCNETLEFSAWIDYSSTIPVVTITQPVDRGRISRVAPCNLATFSWQASEPFAAYEVRVVPTIGSPRSTGTLIGITEGSANTSGSGAFAAETPITTQVTGADLQAASPGDTQKVIKVYVQDLDGIWSP